MPEVPNKPFRLAPSHSTTNENMAKCFMLVKTSIVGLVQASTILAMSGTVTLFPCSSVDSRVSAVSAQTILSVGWSSL